MDQTELPYHVRIENFEGPLDLLLHLIKKNEINIYDIPIALIARRETFRFFGLPLLRRDELDAPEVVLRQIVTTPPRTPIDLVLHAGVGQAIAAEQIAHALIRHPSRVTVFVPHAAIGDALLVALAADELVLDPNAVLGPLMPYAGPYPAVSVLTAVRDKGPAQVDDHTLILADQAEMAIRQVREAGTA